MKTLVLNKGQEVLVDDDVYEWASRHTWAARGHKKGYAVRRAWRSGRYKTVFLHREILNPGHGLLTDHINGDTFDCRRENLRAVTNAQNQQNRTGATSLSRTGYRGVFFDAPRQRYRVRLYLDGRQRYFGQFKTAEAAHAAAIEARRQAMPYSREYGERVGLVTVVQNA